MLINPTYPDDVKRAELYFEKLKSGNCPFEITKKSKKRTLSQNSYVHKLFTLFGIEFGLNVEESKQVIKMALGYTYDKLGKTFLTQTSKMTTKELAVFIDKFRTFSEHQGCYLPSADELKGRYEYYDNEIKRHEKYL